jgi:hypothetical protein
MVRSTLAPGERILTDEANMVPNPFYTALDHLRTQIEAAAPDVTSALDSSTRAMVEGEAWQGTGPAETFAAELTGRKSRLGELMQEVLRQVDAELASTDRMVPAEAARGYHMALRLEGVR